jgi:ferredoxin--NADP+ reductase
MIMRLEDFDTGSTYTATVLSSQRITPEESPEEVRDIVLEVDRPEFHYELGQSVGVIVSGDHDQGHRHHFRLYTIADLADPSNTGNPRVTLCVKRCSYIDEYSGEQYDGIASNYLCDSLPGDSVTINGPFGMPFDVPEDHSADLLLIGMGTGIAPFRGLVKHIYQRVEDWKGRVWLFYGARSGLEMLYMNDEKDDFAQYYDEETFEAFRALSPRPDWGEPAALEGALEQRAEDILAMLERYSTYVYVAGREDILGTLDRVFEGLMGSAERWQQRKAEMKAGRRWVELVY